MKDDLTIRTDENLSESFSVSARRTLTIDVAKYEDYLANSGLTSEQKEEFLRALWTIIVAFVELGFGVHPLQEVCGEGEETVDLTLQEAFNEVGSNHEQDRARGMPRPRRDRMDIE